MMTRHDLANENCRVVVASAPTAPHTYARFGALIISEVAA